MHAKFVDWKKQLQIVYIIKFADGSGCALLFANRAHHALSLSQKNLLCVKNQIMQGNEKTVHNGKFEPKVDFGSVIMFNISKIMILYFLLTRIIKNNDFNEFLAHRRFSLAQINKWEILQA